MDKDKLVSVTAVLHNCADIILDFVQDVSGILSTSYQHFEIVLLDNGSTDETVDLTKQLLKKFKQVRLIILSRNYDEQIAYTAALENCIGDYVVNLDVNTDPPALIPAMVEKAAAGCEIVIAEAVNGNKDPFWYRTFSRLFYRFSNAITDFKVDLNWSNYFCFTRKMVNSIIQIKDRVRYLKYLKTEIGYSHGTVSYERINRSGKKVNKRLSVRFFFAIEMLFSSTEKLMRAATVMALMTSVLSVVYMLYALVIKIFKSDVAAGWTSMSMIIAFMFAVMFFLLFIIGEYLLLVYKETKKGPLYHMADEYCSSVLFADFKDKNVI